MAEALKILNHSESFTGLLNGTVTKGDLVAHNGTGFVRADADDMTLYAVGMAKNDGVSGDTIAIASGVILAKDVDAPYTAKAQLYLSGTAGAITATRPTTAGQLRQAVGYAYDTSTVKFVFHGTKEVTVPVVVKSATSAVAALDSGDFAGQTLDAQNEVAYLQFEIPDNCVAVAYGNLWLAVEATSDTPLFAITVSSVVGADQWDAVTADSTLTASSPEGGAADEIVKLAIATALDATNIVRPGAAIGIKIVSSDAGTVVRHVLGGQVVCRVV